MNQPNEIRPPSPAIRVESARDLGPQFVDNPNRMVGQDGAFSIPLDEKETLWFFGDTLVGARPKDHSIWLIDNQLVGQWDMSKRGTFEAMINNTGLILPAQTGENGLKNYRYLLDGKGGLRNLIPLERMEHRDWDRIWCQHGICIDDRVILSFIQVRMIQDNPGPLPIGFRIIGSGLAVAARGEWDFHRITRRNGEHILWDAHEPHFATAFLQHPTDSYVYLYGTVMQSARQNCFVARALTADLTQPDRYQYFCGDASSWSNRVADATVIFSGMPSELSVSFNAHLGRFLAVHSLDLSGKIIGRTAPQPWGPWSDPVDLWQVRAEHTVPRPYPFTLIYAGKEHPELARDNGRVIYLTYIEFEEYFPHLVEITLG